MKFTPRYVLLEDSAAFSIEARVFNVEELYGVSFRVFWNDEIMAPDSTTLGGGLPTSEVIFFDTVDVDTVLGRRYHAIAITQTVTGNALVDSDGHANLARLYFTRRPFSPAGTDSIYFELTGMTRTDQTDIPLDSVYTDDCMVEIPPDTTAFAAER